MAGDLLLEELFNYEPGWDKAILNGLDKKIRIGLLEQFSGPAYREKLMDRISRGAYHVKPPHEAKVPKDDGTMRTVYANEAEDRLLMAAVNDALFRLCPDMVHSSCKSYRSGIGCGKVAREVSRDLTALDPGLPLLGYKIDLSKYFDSVPRPNIEGIFDQVERRLGASSVLELCREYYRSDVLLDLDRKPVVKYTSLRQGCAVAAFLADAALRHIDEELSSSGAPYYRYSDDILILGPDSEKLFRLLSARLKEMGLALNPKKVERLEPGRWFTFLGFALHPDGLVSLSRKRVGNFQKAVEDRTVNAKAANNNSDAALARLASYLYDGTFTGYGYAEGILPVVNSRDDLRQMDLFVLDCLRACDTGKTKLGGLGWDRYRSGGVIARGRGRNVAMNRAKRPRIEHYVPLAHMQAAYLHSRAAYDAYANAMRCPG